MDNVTLEGLSLMVTDLEKSIDFYARIPGAQLEMQRPGQFARFRIGTGSVHLVQLGGKTGFHIEMNTDNLTNTHEQLQAAGLKPGRPQHHPWGKTDFRLIDPDGNAIEFGAIDGE